MTDTNLVAELQEAVMACGQIILIGVSIVVVLVIIGELMDRRDDRRMME